jgi:N-acetylglucosamine-6-phosphate deacetylase
LISNLKFHDCHTMIVLSGADLILPDRLVSAGTIVIDGARIVDIRSGAASGGHGQAFAFHNHYIVPGFIDVHVHGVNGVDVLDGVDSVRRVAAALPRYGVTAFCPTTVACTPEALRETLQEVRNLRAAPGRGARVLPAHLESNFINPAYHGAQPVHCLRSPAAIGKGVVPLFGEGPSQEGVRPRFPDSPGAAFTAEDILHEIERAAPDVGIVTVAPELDGGLDLVRWLTSRGHRVSLGHSGAGYEEALAAIAAGATQATHLFNRMPPFGHRAPGLVGAVLQTEDVAAELICDGIHVHPAVVRTAIAAKRPSRVMAITDGTAASGLPAGARAMLGGQPITVRDSAAFLDDGTLAGSVSTMDRVFQLLVGPIGLSLVDAATLCATTPARELGLVRHGVLAVDAVADLLVLDAQLSVVQTYVGGELVYSRTAA